MTPDWTVISYEEAVAEVKAHSIVEIVDGPTGADLHFRLGNGQVLAYWAPMHGSPEDWWLLTM